MDNRGAIFIDAGYFEKVLELEFGRVKVDYEKLALALCGTVPLFRAYYYNCSPFIGNPPTADERRRQASAERFYHALSLLDRFETRRGVLARRSCKNCGAEKFEQKRVDILLSIDLTSLAAKRAITHAFLVAGDSDFIPSVALAKSEGVEVHLVHGGPTNRPHADLLAVCDMRRQIDTALIDLIRRS